MALQMEVQTIKETLGDHFRMFTAEINGWAGSDYKVKELKISTVYNKDVPVKFLIGYCDSFKPEKNPTHYYLRLDFDQEKRSEQLLVQASKVAHRLLEKFQESRKDQVRTLVNEIPVEYGYGILSLDVYNSPMTKEDLEEDTAYIEKLISEGTKSKYANERRTELNVVGEKGKHFKELLVDEWGFMSLKSEKDGIYTLEFKQDLFNHSDNMKVTVKVFIDNLETLNICAF